MSAIESNTRQLPRVNTKLTSTRRNNNITTDYTNFNKLEDPNNPKVGRGQLWVSNNDVLTFTDSLDVDHYLSGGNLTIKDEGVTLGTAGVLNWIGAGVTATKSATNVATITTVEEGLEAVLTVGDDAAGLNIVNLGSLNFDTSTTKGIEIGTDSAGGSTDSTTGIAIGPGSQSQGSGGIAIGILAVITATGTNSDNIAIGGGATVSGVNNTRSTVIGKSSSSNSAYSSVFGADSSATGINSLVIGVDSSAGINCTAIGSDTTVTGSNSLGIGSDASLTVTGADSVLITQGNSNNSLSGDRCTYIGHCIDGFNSGNDNVSIKTNNIQGTRNVAIGPGNSIGGDDSVTIGASYDLESNCVCFGIDNGYLAIDTISFVAGTVTLTDSIFLSKGSITQITNIATSSVILGIPGDDFDSTNDTVIGSGIRSTGNLQEYVGVNNTIIGAATRSDTGGEYGVAIGNNHSFAAFENIIAIGDTLTATADNQILLGNSTNYLRTDLSTAGTAGAISTYLQVNINGTDYKIALKAVS